MVHTIILKERDKNGEFIRIDCEYWKWNYTDIEGCVEILIECFEITDKINNKAKRIGVVPLFNVLYVIPDENDIYELQNIEHQVSIKERDSMFY